MNSEEFYLGTADYFSELKKKLVGKRKLIFETMKAEAELKSSENSYPSVPEIKLKQLSLLTNNIKTKKADHPENLSGHIRVLNSDGSVSEYYLELTKHHAPFKAESTLNTILSSASPQPGSEAYIALDVDAFYVKDDEQGEEIWPVTFPAQSLDDPNKVIDITVYKDGSIKWPKEKSINTTFSTISASSGNTSNELYYLQPSELQICTIDDNSCSDPGTGGGSTGGGSTSAPSWTDAMPYMEVESGEFLALKSIRVHDRRDSGSLAEMLMQIQSMSNDNDVIQSDWDYAFDRKEGIFGNQGFLNGISFLDVVGAIFNPRDLFVKIFNNRISNEPDIFNGENTRTFGHDGAVYEVPDVNEAGITYYFANMRRWVSQATLLNLDGVTFPTAEDFELVEFFQETARIDYFPIAPLTNVPYRLIMHEDDANYRHYANASEVFGTAYKDVETYNMATGNYNMELTAIESKDPGLSSSDDTIRRSGVKNITYNNTMDRMENGQIIAKKDGHEYVFTVVNRNILCVPTN